MAKRLTNQEIAPARDGSSAELEQFSSSPNRRLNQGVSAGPLAAPRAQRIVELRPRSMADEGQRASEAAEWKHTAKEKIEDVTARGAQAASQLRSSAFRAYANMRTRALAVLQNGKQKSGELASNVRRRIRHTADEYPAQTIAAVAGAALICGVLLRVWRSSRYE